MEDYTIASGGAIAWKGILLAGLVLVLVGIVYQQWQAGMLDNSQAALPIVLNMGLLPALLIVPILRSQWFRWLENCISSI